MRRIVWLVPLGFLALVFLVFGQTLHHEFINLDDKGLLVDNPTVHGLSVKNVKQAFTTFDPELYIPLTLLTYQAEYSITGLSPFLIHLDNLLLHTANALLAAWIVFLLIDHFWIALFCGLVFAVHPQNVEAVVWASARKDLLSAFFCFGSLAMYVALTIRKEVLPSPSGEGLRMGARNRRGAWCEGLFALALLSKVSVVLLPLALLLTDWFREGKITKRALRSKIPFAILSVFFLIIAAAGKSAALGETTLMQKVLLAPLTILFTVRNFFFPSHLSLLYPYTKPISILNPDIFLSLTGVAVLLTVTLISLRRTKKFAYGMTFFLLLLSPSLLNIRRGIDFYFASDRYAYVPSLGLLVLVAFALKRIAESANRGVKEIGAVFMMFVVALFSWNAHAQTAVWQDNRSLYTSVLSLYPNAYAANANFGLDALERGRPDEAIPAFMAALRMHRTDDVRTNLSIAENNLGSRLMGEKKWPEAVLVLEKAAALHPVNGDVYYNLGVSYEHVGRIADAIRALQEAVRLNPEDREAGTHLHDLLSKLKGY